MSETYFLPLGTLDVTTFHAGDVESYLTSNGVLNPRETSVLTSEGVVQTTADSNPSAAWATFTPPTPVDVDPLHIADVLLNGTLAQRNELKAIIAEWKAQQS
jgi:hypothetical protein